MNIGRFLPNCFYCLLELLALLSFFAALAILKKTKRLKNMRRPYLTTVLVVTGLIAHARAKDEVKDTNSLF